MCHAPSLCAELLTQARISHHIPRPFTSTAPSTRNLSYNNSRIFPTALPQHVTPPDPNCDWLAATAPSCLLDCSVPEIFANLTTVKALRNAVQSRPSLRDDLVSLSSRPWLTEPLSSLASNSELANLLEQDPEFRCEVQIFLQRLDQSVRPEDVVWLVQALYKASVHPVIYSIIDFLEELMNPDRLASVDEAIVLGVSTDRLYAVIQRLNQVPPQQIGEFITICRQFWTDQRIDASLDFLDLLVATEDHLLEKVEHILDILLVADKKTYEHFAIHQVFVLLLKSIIEVGSSLSVDNLPTIAALYDSAIESPQLLQAAIHKLFYDRRLQRHSPILLAALHTILQPCIIQNMFKNLPGIVNQFHALPAVVSPERQLPATSRWHMYANSFQSLSSQDVDTFIIDISTMITHMDQKGILGLLAASQLPSQTESAISKLFLLLDFFFSSPAMLQRFAADLHASNTCSPQGSGPASVLAQAVGIPLEAAVKLRIERLCMLLMLVFWRVMPYMVLEYLLNLAVKRALGLDPAATDDNMVMRSSSRTS